MELRLQNPTLPVASCSHTRNSKSRFNVGSLSTNKAKVRSQETGRVLSALPETAASIAVAATVVGAAATFLARRNKSSDVTEPYADFCLDSGCICGRQAPAKICEDCGGSGVCSECNGEGFVLKRLSDENAEKARLMAQNAATRYTAGLPKKWSYCTKCSSARSCNTCGGSGKLGYLN